MKNILTKYKELQTKYQVIIAVSIFILGIFILPNIIVYAVATVFYFKTINKKIWKYLVATILGLVTFCSFVLLIADYIPASPVVDNIQNIQKTIQNETPINTEETKTVNESSQNNTQNSEEESVQYTYYSVTQVVDGDTVKLSIDGKEETLRLGTFKNIMQHPLP